jgi:hypothetical protein
MRRYAEGIELQEAEHAGVSGCIMLAFANGSGSEARPR